MEEEKEPQIEEVISEEAGSEEKIKKKIGIQTDIMQVNTYIQEVADRIKSEKPVLYGVLDNVSQPLYKDPLMILAHL